LPPNKRKHHAHHAHHPNKQTNRNTTHLQPDRLHVDLGLVRVVDVGARDARGDVAAAADREHQRGHKAVEHAAVADGVADGVVHLLIRPALLLVCIWW
jgi:hypothetical protein